MNTVSWSWHGSILLAGFIFLIQIAASTHILRSKDDVRSAISWIGLVWLAPIFGLLAYLLFGISRIQRRARLSRQKRGLAPRTGTAQEPKGPTLAHSVPDSSEGLRAHARLAGKVSGSPLTEGNSISPMQGGRDAYDAMIAAIDAATKTIALTSYIFQADQAGRRFVAALTRAHERGVEIRVLVDAVGNLYDMKPVSHLLRRLGIPFALFNPARFSWRLAFFNLRTHRKILIVDGKTGFTGGMNIRRQHLEGTDGKPSVRDTHFGLKGPIVTRMAEAFADDWLFAMGEELPEKLWLPKVPPAETGITARAVADGPDEPNRKISTMMESALASARSHVRIVSPYFLPGESLLAALKMAALRGVKIDILIPGTSNIRLFNIVILTNIYPLVKAGCNLYLSNPPFDHTKLMTVDGCWALFGSSNWDARSLKLNFEFNIEAYDVAFAKKMEKWADKKLEDSRQIMLDDLKAIPLYKRIVGRILWLASPYL
ncbi:phospholipase D-like domain-containing protein [Kordiimonas pumila]|uniref:Phospholipase D n=1 Tax=Kordiimonas pumila TaxID=2161677 RepID=A0ABV7D3L8_9PROT|nr:phospholipase D-like domain-containing protein [Kordiimonas pumila]